MASFTVVMRDTNTNAVDDITRLQTKVGSVTGTPSAIYTLTVAAEADDRADAIRNTMANDPHILGISYAA